MRRQKVIHTNNQYVVAERARIAEHFFTRLKGLLGSASLPQGEGLFIRPSNSVHTIGMKYPIDVLFLSRRLEVLKVVAKLEPMRLTGCWGSYMVLELPAGTAEKADIKIGSKLEVVG